jgi:hypothetical protein
VARQHEPARLVLFVSVELSSRSSGPEETLSPPLLATYFCGEQKRAAFKSSNQEVARANIYSNLDEHDELRLSVDPGLATHQQIRRKRSFTVTSMKKHRQWCRTPTRSAIVRCRQVCTAPSGCRTRTLTARRPSTHCLPPPSKQALESAPAATAPPLCASSCDLSPSTTSEMVCLPPPLPAREPEGRKCCSRTRIVSVEPRLRGALAARRSPLAGSSCVGEQLPPRRNEAARAGTNDGTRYGGGGRPCAPIAPIRRGLRGAALLLAVPSGGELQKRSTTVLASCRPTLVISDGSRSEGAFRCLRKRGDIEVKDI